MLGHKECAKILLGFQLGNWKQFLQSTFSLWQEAHTESLNTLRKILRTLSCYLRVGQTNWYPPKFAPTQDESRVWKEVSPTQHQSLLILLCFLWFQVHCTLQVFTPLNCPVWFEAFLSVFFFSIFVLDIVTWFLFCRGGATKLRIALSTQLSSSGSWNYIAQCGTLDRWRIEEKT